MKKDIKEERGECNWGKVRFRVKLYEGINRERRWKW